MTVCRQELRDPRVTVVIVNWNKRQYVINLLNSLRSIDYDNYSIVIVDNASSDDSVSAIKSHDISVTLLENSENLGGTGGFNTGIDFALRHLSQDYLWLLDNDAEVLPNTLKELVKLMERDETIGIAGSCIMSPEDHDFIVEAGAFVGWSSGTSNPHLRYKRADSYLGERVIDVDSVAACSALVRDAVVRSVGLMDERFFLHWDDIDYCIRICKAGFRVVVVLDAPAFHVAEKGYNPVISYYNFRNALLFQAKHKQGIGLILNLFNIVTNYLTLTVYLFVLGEKKAAAYLFSALRDFCRRRFGRAATSPINFAPLSPVRDPINRDTFVGLKKVLVFAVGSFENTAAAIKEIKGQASGVSITIAVAADRAEVYSLLEVDDIVRFDFFKSGILSKMKTAWDVIKGGFHCGITVGGPFIVPYAFLLRRNLNFDSQDGSFRNSGASFFTLWKVPLAMVAGKLLTVMYLAPVAWVSVRLRAGGDE